MEEQIIETATGLGYVDIVEGTGARPKTGDPSACTTPVGSRAVSSRLVARLGPAAEFPIKRGASSGWTRASARCASAETEPSSGAPRTETVARAA